MDELFEKLDFDGVHQHKVLDNEIRIKFEIKGVSYGLEVAKNSSTGLFYPYYLYHSSEDTCTLCFKKKEKFGICNPLFEKKNELFHRLIEYPSIRLEWLYIPHD